MPSQFDPARMAERLLQDTAAGSSLIPLAELATLLGIPADSRQLEILDAMPATDGSLRTTLHAVGRTLLVQIEPLAAAEQKLCAALWDWCRRNGVKTFTRDQAYTALGRDFEDDEAEARDGCLALVLDDLATNGALERVQPFTLERQVYRVRLHLGSW